jgi:hypothetical protein
MILLWYNYNSWQDPRIRIQNRSWLKLNEILARSSLWFLSGFWIGLTVNLSRILQTQFRKKSEQELEQILDRILNQTWQDPWNLWSWKILLGFLKKWTRLSWLNSNRQRSLLNPYIFLSRFWLGLISSCKVWKRIFLKSSEEDPDWSFPELVSFVFWLILLFSC